MECLACNWTLRDTGFALPTKPPRWPPKRNHNIATVIVFLYIYILKQFYFCLYIINDRNGIILGMLFIILLFTLCTFCPPLQHTYTHKVEMWYQNQIMHKMNYLARFICLFCICTNCCSKTSFRLTGRDRVTHEFNFVGWSLQLVSTLAPAVIHVSITWSIPGEQSWSETKVLIRQISRVTRSKEVSGSS